MRTIKTEEDLQVLERAQVLPQPLLAYLIREFHRLQQALSDADHDAPFDLYDHGYMVLLEPGDNVRDLREVGLNRVDRGLLGAMPEYVIAGTKNGSPAFLVQSSCGLEESSREPRTPLRSLRVCQGRNEMGSPAI